MLPLVDHDRLAGRNRYFFDALFAGRPIEQGQLLDAGRPRFEEHLHRHAVRQGGLGLGRRAPAAAGR